jgi:hypothetical protein
MAEEAKPRGGVLQRLVLWLVILLLLGAVWFLASERNERHFRTVAENGRLVIERGRFFPTGTRPSADTVYAPLDLPDGGKPPGEMEFDDQNELDRYLFGLMDAWAKEAAKRNDTHAAAALVERASALPGLTGSQVAELAAMKGELASDDAQTSAQQAGALLDAAVRNLRMVAAGKGVHAFEAQQEAERLHALAQSLRNPPVAKSQPAPAAPPPARPAVQSPAGKPAPPAK